MRRSCYHLQDRFKHYRVFTQREFRDIRANGLFYLLIPLFFIILSLFSNHKSFMEFFDVSIDDYFFIMLIYSQSIIALVLSSQVYFLERVSYVLPTLMVLVPPGDIIIGKMLFISLSSILVSLIYIISLCILLNYFTLIILFFIFISVFVISFTILISGLLCYVGKDRTMSIVLLIVPFILLNLSIFLRDFINLELIYCIISVIYFVCFYLATKFFSMKIKQILLNTLE